MALRPPMSEETIAVLRARQARLTALANNDNFAELEAEVEREAERKRRTVIARTMGGGARAPELPQREIDYLRGFMDGARWLVAVPRNAERRLEHELQKQKEK